MFSTFFTEKQVRDWSYAATSDTKRFGAFFQEMLRRGVYLAPSQFESGFMSAAHGEKEIMVTIAAVEESFQAIK